MSKSNCDETIDKRVENAERPLSSPSPMIMHSSQDTRQDTSDLEERLVFRGATTRMNKQQIDDNKRVASPPGLGKSCGYLDRAEFSRASTTSVNSQDDTGSIVSRLSQIITEQELKQAFELERQKLANQGDGANQDHRQQHAQPSELRSLKHKHHNKDPNEENNSSFPGSPVTGGVQAHQDHLQHQQASSSYMDNSMPSSNHEQDLDELDEHETGSGCQLIDLPKQLAFRTRQNENRLPERGNIRALEESRLQQLILNGEACARRNRSATTTGVINNQQSTPMPTNNSLDDEDSLMLNIRRSTWTLSEFDETYNKLSDKHKSSSSMNMNNNIGQNSNSNSPNIHSNPNLKSLGDSTNSLPGLFPKVTSNNGNNNTSSSSTLKSTYTAFNQQQQQQVSLTLDPISLQARIQGIPKSDNIEDNNDNPDCLVSANKGHNNNNNNYKTNSLSQQQQQQLYSSRNLTLEPNGAAKEQRRPSIANSIVSLASSIENTFSLTTPFAKRRLNNKNQQTNKLTKNHGQRAVNNINYSSSSNNNNNNNDQSNYDEHSPNNNNNNCCSILNNKWCPSFNLISQYVPIIEWLPNYNWSFLYGDLMAGIAVAVLNISTSLSAAVVAETDLGVAFKTSIVNTFIYALLCSSRHTSFGSYSIMSQMLLVSVQRALSDELILSRLNLGPTAGWQAHEYERWNLNIIVMFTFLIGLIQLTCGLLNLGYIVASFIPEALSSSMIAATAFTMAIGQLANMCGTSNKILWSIEKNTTELWADLKDSPSDITDLFANLFRWVQQCALLCRYYEQINPICVLISIITVLILCLNQYFIQKQLKSYFKRDIFIPIEMILLIIMIIVSYSLDLAGQYHVPTCGPIEIDLKVPDLPNLRLIRELWFQSLATALISYTTVHIMSKTYSNKCNYEVDSNQELIACGAGNLIGGLFDAMPAAASFSRTAGQVEAGGQTQMASIFNCILLIILTHFLGQHVAPLPVSVMAATLFYGFVRMMSKMSDVFKYWRICKVDFANWIVTFVAILATDLVTGFVYGFIFSILTLLYRAQNRRCYMLGNIPGSPDVFVPLSKYPMAREIESIKIFQYCGPIHYVSEELFERLLRSKTKVNIKLLTKAIQPAPSTNDTIQNLNIDQYNIDQFTNKNPLPTHIILDFSMIAFIDSSGLHILKKIIEDYNRVNVTILIASMASHVASIVKNDPSLWGTHKDRFYVTLADAVHNAMRTNHLQQLHSVKSLANHHSPLDYQFNNPAKTNINNNNNHMTIDSDKQLSCK